MAGFYPYLMASLPGLYAGARPPFTYKRFLALCAGLVPEADAALIRQLPGPGTPPSAAANGTLRRWLAFETMLRNEFAAVRAARKKTDAARYLRPDGSPESDAEAHIAVNVYRRSSPREGERELDLERWRKLDELALGHYFDLDALIVYAYKLLILEKWQRIAAADGAAALEASLALPAQAGRS